MDEGKPTPLEYETIPVAEPAGWFHDWKYVIVAGAILLVLAMLFVA